MDTMPNTLFFGDNLNILREHLADDSIDLSYLDPPFNSKRDYNLLFKTPKGHASEAQITTFEDSWHCRSRRAEVGAQLDRYRHHAVGDQPHREAHERGIPHSAI
jgi:adenine specific DNA methylase Mod